MDMILVNGEMKVTGSLRFRAGEGTNNPQGFAAHQDQPSSALFFNLLRARSVSF